MSSILLSPISIVSKLILDTSLTKLSKNLSAKRIFCNRHKDEVPTAFNTQLEKLTGQTIPEDVLTEALTRLEFTDDPIKLSLFQSANDAYDMGFLAKGEERPDLTGIYDLTLLDQVLSEKGLPTIKDAGGGQLLSPGNTTGQSQGLTDVA